MSVPKPFQEAAVDAALSAFANQDGRRRFLVADEVGLGKTVVAKEVARRMSEDGRRPLVIYYIANGHAVSHQNKGRVVSFLDEPERKAAVATPDRLSLIAVSKRPDKPVLIYALTPATSFPGARARLTGGRKEERAFLKVLLDRAYPAFARDLDPAILRLSVGVSWDWLVEDAERKLAAAPPHLTRRFREALAAEFGEPVRERLEQALSGDEERKIKPLKPTTFVGHLRRALALATLRHQPPDLVILDEFQRYRQLLDEKDADPLLKALLDRHGSEVARDLYASAYGFSHMRERSARRSSHDHHHDAWEAAKIVFRGLENGEKLLGLPALGGLFTRGATPDLDDAKLPNRAFLRAIFHLSWLIEDGRRVRVNWRDMATEELGSVYEGLLELVPIREDHGRRFGFANADEAKGNARKTSGSYYTPDSLVQTLLDSTLDPVLMRAEAEGGAEAILKLSVIDPACGSGHFLLGAARRMAVRVAQLRDSEAPDYPAAMRDVVRHSIHGVDRNPMAVELAKVALWIEALEPGKPLNFLDSHIRCGDSLIGVFNIEALRAGIPDEAYEPLAGDDPDLAKVYARRNKEQREGKGASGFLSSLKPPTGLIDAARALAEMPEGATRVPSFLLHDSPREADLGLSIYGRLFDIGQELERVGRKPLFQYIVTTTTAPPAEFRELPYLQLKLHGDPPAQRLLRVDL